MPSTAPVATQSSTRPSSTPQPLKSLTRQRRPPPASSTPVQSQPQRQQPSDTPTAVSLRSQEQGPNPLPSRARQLGPPRESDASELSPSAVARRRRLIKIGIEVEFYLKALDPSQNEVGLDDFMKTLAKGYNRSTNSRHPRMRGSIRPYRYRGRYNEWCLVVDPSLGNEYLPWGIELVSPVFVASPHSTWRKDVELMWNYLNENYEIFGNLLCSTHIHIGVEPDFNLTELKRIAQAVIHFETAFECLVPSHRRDNFHTMSNWLDTPGFAEKGRSRPDCVAAIDAASSISRLVGLLHPPARWYYDGMRRRTFNWNFLSLYVNGSIEFRKPPVSLTSDAALSWAELALSFVQASMACESSQALQDIPPTVRGLRWFLDKFGTRKGVNQPARLQQLWAGRHPELFVEPMPQLQYYTDSKLFNPGQVRELYDRLLKMVKADKERVKLLIQKGRGKY